MINLQSLLSQLTMSNQPTQALLGLLDPQQKQIFSQMQGKSDLDKAEAIAKMCNEKGISKDQLSYIISYISGNKS